MIDQIRPADLQQWIAANAAHGPAVVLDVREPHELQMASIRADGFELVCIPMGVIPPRLPELDESRPVACLCHHGGRSMQVAAFLSSRGFAHVANIAGGINAWSVEVDPGVARY
jgi:rhodanese-related sulfurtransferase